MNNNQLQLVTFEQAKPLKRIGFDWECNHFFSSYNGRIDISEIFEMIDQNGVDPTKFERFSAPTVQLALKWFRDVKNILGFCFLFDENRIDYFDFIIYNSNKNKRTIRGGYPYKTYEEAESALLDELIKLAINDKKEK